VRGRSWSLKELGVRRILPEVKVPTAKSRGNCEQIVPSHGEGVYE
jgi:hypothetical protein